jgi:hypothetical protein
VVGLPVSTVFNQQGSGERMPLIVINEAARLATVSV